MIELRDYQKELAEQGLAKLNQFKICYFAIEMRVGKTLIALQTAKLFGADSVLMITKKKAISSIEKDYNLLNPKYKFKVTNYEQVQNCKDNYDLIIIDEAHSLGAFPKPSERTKKIRELAAGKPIIYLSGTPSPESYSQLYHQLWCSSFSPFNHKNFYAWSKEYCEPRQKKVNSMLINDYSFAKEKLIKEQTDKLMITYTQTQAGFVQSKISEDIVSIALDTKLSTLATQIAKNGYYKFRDGTELICDTAIKKQSAIHQLSSGTIKVGENDRRVLDYGKAFYIKDNYSHLKVAIFYKFIAELEAIKSVLSNLTFDPMQFNESNDKIFVSQIQSGSMGVNLSTADVLIFYNVDFSATNYFQSINRLSTKDRVKEPKIIWLVNEQGIERKVLDAVRKKKDYTLNYFKKDYGLTDSKRRVA